MSTAAREWLGPHGSRWCALLVVVVTAWQVHGVVDFGFVDLDDGINLVFNPHLGPPGWGTWSWLATDTDYMRRYVPLSWLAFSLVYGVSGLAPAGYHLAGAAVHVINAGLVYAVVLAVLRRGRPAAGDGGRAGMAALAALGWALHPMRAETVGWASGLMYGVSGCMALLAVLAYLRAWEAGAARGRWVMAAAGLHLGALLAYPVALGLVVVLVAWDAAQGERARAFGWRRLWLEKVWFLGPAVAVATVTWVAGHGASDFWGTPPSREDFPLWERVLQAAAAWGYYLVKPWWPEGLSPVPTWLVEPAAVRGLAVASLGVVVAVSLGLAVTRRWRGAAWLWLAHAGLLLPALGWAERPYFPVDRYHYLPSIVLVTAVAVALDRTSGRGRVALGLAGTLAVGIAAELQRRQLAHWADNDTLMARIVTRAEHPAVRREYGERWIKYHAHQGDQARSVQLAQDLGLPPVDAGRAAPDGVPLAAALHAQLARDFRRQERWREAGVHQALAVQIAPGWSEAAYNWALEHARQGAPMEAWRWYRRSLAATCGAPIPSEARQRLLLVIAEGAATEGRVRTAEKLLETALREGAGRAGDTELDRRIRAELERWRGKRGN